MPNQSVLVMCGADADNNPRPMRMIRCLGTAGYAITAVAVSGSSSLIKKFIPLPKTSPSYLDRLIRGGQLKLRRFESYIWDKDRVALRDKLCALEFDAVVCHDLHLLPLALAAAKGAPVLFDAREFYPRHFEDQFTWRFFFQALQDYLVKNYMGRAAHVVTVSPGLAEEYKACYSIECEVLMSLPVARDISPRQVDDEHIRIIHHGNAAPSRRIERMIEMMDHVDPRFSLDLMLVPAVPSYLDHLRAEAQKRDNVNIIDPVAFEQIVPVSSQYDIGLFYAEPTTFNLEHCLPNKFFEFIQARLCVAIGPSPDMAGLIREHNCGVVADAFTPLSMAQTLNALNSEDIMSFKRNADIAAAHLHAATNCERLLELLPGLIDR